MSVAMEKMIDFEFPKMWWKINIICPRKMYGLIFSGILKYLGSDAFTKFPY